MNYKVRVCSRVEGVLAAAHIVSSVVDAKDFMGIKFVLLDNDLAKLFRCEYCLVTIVGISEETSQKMRFQPRYKILESTEWSAKNVYSVMLNVL